nr:UDP-glycosyltransferase 89B1-like [Tanacetum cinerariifolium]
ASDSSFIPSGFKDRVADRGFIVKGWAPQLAILRHQAVGSFVTHCGWNSTLEGVAAGVMMLTWPMGADQYADAKLLVDQLGVGKRVCEGGPQGVPNSVELARVLDETLSGDIAERVKVRELSLDKDYSSKNYVRKFLRALHPKWRAKVTTIEESKDLTSLSLDELIRNLKESSDEECSTSKSKDEEYAMAVRDFKTFFKRRDPNHLIGEYPKPPKDTNQRAFVRGSWSDSGAEDDEKAKDKTCFVAQALNEGTSFETVVYTDFDHARDYVDRKSTSGICTFVGCCLTSWFSKKQPAFAISTIEAEYLSTGKACQQALWMKKALIDYDIRLNDVLIMCDNKGAIDLSKKLVQHSRTKHIKIRHHFLRDNVQKGHISIEKVSAADNIADFLTKPLKRESFNCLHFGLGMIEHIS